jgi:hypothetical protein
LHLRSSHAAHIWSTELSRRYSTAIQRTWRTWRADLDEDT